MRTQLKAKVKSRSFITVLMIALLVTFLVSDITENIAEHIIKEVYMPLIGKSVTITADDSGVPLVDYKYIDGVYIGEQRNPVTVSQKALLYYESYNTDNGNDRQLFLNCADWLVNNAVGRGDYAVLEYTFPWSYGNMTPPWRSGMAQGQALQVLIRAHTITNDEKYLDSAKKLLTAFFVEVENGGVTYKTEQGWWYEEYADEGCEETRALNGMMFAVLGIHEYYEYTKDADAQYLVEQGTRALKEELPQYDRDGYSCYDILGAPAKQYHEIHVQLLGQLYEITEEELFKEYYGKWENYKEPPFMIRLLQNPSKMKIIFFFGNFFGLFILFEIIVWVIRKNPR